MRYKAWKWAAVKLIESLPPKAQDYIIASLLLDDFHMLPSGSEEQDIVNAEVADFIAEMYHDVITHGDSTDIVECAKIAQALFRKVAQTQRMIYLPDAYLRAQAYCAALTARAQAILAQRREHPETSCNTADDSVSP